jgi:hypothetical protein
MADQQAQLQRAGHSNPQPGEPVVDILELNNLQRLLGNISSNWDKRFQSLVPACQLQRLPSGSDAGFVDDPTIISPRVTTVITNGKVTHVVEGLTSSKNEAAIDGDSVQERQLRAQSHDGESDGCGLLGSDGLDQSSAEGYADSSRKVCCDVVSVEAGGAGSIREELREVVGPGSDKVLVQSKALNSTTTEPALVSGINTNHMLPKEVSNGQERLLVETLPLEKQVSNPLPLTGLIEYDSAGKLKEPFSQSETQGAKTTCCLLDCTFLLAMRPLHCELTTCLNTKSFLCNGFRVEFTVGRRMWCKTKSIRGTFPYLGKPLKLP